MDKEISLESIWAKLESIENLLRSGSPSHAALAPPSFLPGGIDWLLSASVEERRAFNRKRAQELRRKK